MTARKRRPAPARTPVRITHRLRNLRTGRIEIWGAVSVDGKFTYRRTEDSRTTWEIEAEGHKGFTLASSLLSAREETENGSALKAIERQEAKLAAIGGAR